MVFIIFEIEGKDPVLFTEQDDYQLILNQLSQSLQTIPDALSVKLQMRGVWFKIASQQAYEQFVKKQIDSGADEITLKVEIEQNSQSQTPQPVLPQVPPAPQPTQVPQPQVPQSNPSSSQLLPNWAPQTPQESLAIEDEGAPVTISYRHLNGASPLSVKNLSAGQDIRVSRLATLILINEGIDINNWDCAIYNDVGLPLTATIPLQFQVKYSQISSNTELLVITLPKVQYDGLVDPNQGTNEIRVVYQTFKYTIKVNLQTETVNNLKSRLARLFDIQKAHITVSFLDSIIPDKLIDIGVKENSKLDVTYNNPGGESTTYRSNLFLTYEQTDYGIQIFHSLLYVLFRNMRISTDKKICAALRIISNCNHTLVSAFYSLINQEIPCQLERIALQEGLTDVFFKIYERATGNAIAEKNKLFEHCLLLFDYLEALRLKITDEQLSQIENYKFYSTICEITKNPMKKPSYVIRDGQAKATADYDALMKCIQEQKDVGDLGQIQANEIVTPKKLATIVALLKLMSISSRQIWEGDISRMPSIDQIAQNLQFEWKLPTDPTHTISGNSRFNKIYAPHVIKLESRPRLTIGSNLKLVVSLGPSPCSVNKIDTINVLNADITEQDADDLSNATSTYFQITRTNESGQEVVDDDDQPVQREPEEVTVVILDVSGSMRQQFCNDNQYTRVDAVKNFFYAFADRVVGYNLSHVLSIVTFNNRPNDLCNFTEYLSRFVDRIEQAEAGGGTALWNSIIHACNKIKNFKKSHPEFKSVLCKILCLSDGEDTSSNCSHIDALNMLVDNQIILDTVVVGLLSDKLKAITIASGGLIYLPESVEKGIKLFEQETFLRAKLREIRPAQRLQEEQLKKIEDQGFSTSVPAMRKNQQLDGKFKSVEQVLLSKPTGSGATRRITKELQSISRVPHPDIKVFPAADNLHFWRGVMRGPDGTPYQGGSFQFYIEFAPDYPFKAPTMRFITKIYHCNINENGNICHSILQRNYSPAVSIRAILDNVYGLLLTPEPDDPIDSNIAAQCIHDYPVYSVRASEMTALHASDSFEEIIQNLSGS